MSRDKCKTLHFSSRIGAIVHLCGRIVGSKQRRGDNEIRRGPVERHRDVVDFSQTGERLHVNVVGLCRQGIGEEEENVQLPFRDHRTQLLVTTQRPAQKGGNVQITDELLDEATSGDAFHHGGQLSESGPTTANMLSESPLPSSLSATVVRVPVTVIVFRWFLAHPLGESLHFLPLHQSLNGVVVVQKFALSEDAVDFLAANPV